MANPVNDYNRQIIEEFRANEGRVGGPFEGATLLLLTHKGAKTGTARTNPLAYIEENGRYFVFGSKGGASTNPDWYHNLRANPNATIEIGTEHCVIREFFLEVKSAVENLLASMTLDQMASRQREILARRISVPLDLPCNLPSRPAAILPILPD